MDKYTPTTEEVRGIYEVARALHPEATGGLASPGEVMAEFDRWLNAERARVRRETANYLGFCHCGGSLLENKRMISRREVFCPLPDCPDFAQTFWIERPDFIDRNFID